MSDSGMSGMGHGASDGMATDAELERLEQADGADGQQLYLTLMTAHHQGAIAMARTEISDGTNADAIQLAEDIVASQQREVGVMKKLLARL